MPFHDLSSPNAINVNPSSSRVRLTAGASDWDWAVFALMALSTLVMIGWSHRRAFGQRVFHQLPIIVLTTMSIAYFAMASDLGRTAITSEFHGHVSRDIFWVRWIMWFICAPILVLMLLLSSGVTLSDIFLTVFMTWVWTVCYLVGALVTTRFKWGFYAFGTAALLYVCWLMLGHARGSAFAAGTTLRTGFTRGAGYLSTVWLLYAVAWGVCEGGNRIGIAGEMIFYGILDLLAGPVFLLFVLHTTLRNLDYNSLGLYSGKTTGYNNMNNNMNNGTVGRHAVNPPMATTGTGPGATV